MKKTTLPNHPAPETDNKNAPEFPGYPIYPPSEDVFNQWQDDLETGIEDAPEIDLPLEKDLPERKNSPDFTDGEASGNEFGSTGSELDIPGSELDDAQEKIGSEDEENNFYSLPD